MDSPTLANAPRSLNPGERSGDGVEKRAQRHPTDDDTLEEFTDLRLAKVLAGS